MMVARAALPPRGDNVWGKKKRREGFAWWRKEKLQVGLNRADGAQSECPNRIKTHPVGVLRGKRGGGRRGKTNPDKPHLSSIAQKGEELTRGGNAPEEVNMNDYVKKGPTGRKTS